MSSRCDVAGCSLESVASHTASDMPIASSRLYRFPAPPPGSTNRPPGPPRPPPRPPGSAGGPLRPPPRPPRPPRPPSASSWLIQRTTTSSAAPGSAGGPLRPPSRPPPPLPRPPGSASGPPRPPRPPPGLSVGGWFSSADSSSDSGDQLRELRASRSAHRLCRPPVRRS
jgi:hypothetical protein